MILKLFKIGFQTLSSLLALKVSHTYQICGTKFAGYELCTKFADYSIQFLFTNLHVVTQFLETPKGSLQLFIVKYEADHGEITLSTLMQLLLNSTPQNMSVLSTHLLQLTIFSIVLNVFLKGNFECVASVSYLAYLHLLMSSTVLSWKMHCPLESGVCRHCVFEGSAC